MGVIVYKYPGFQSAVLALNQLIRIVYFLVFPSLMEFKKFSKSSRKDEAERHANDAISSRPQEGFLEQGSLLPSTSRDNAISPRDMAFHLAQVLTIFNRFWVLGFIEYKFSRLF